MSGEHKIVLLDVSGGRTGNADIMTALSICPPCWGYTCGRESARPTSTQAPFPQLGPCPRAGNHAEIEW